MYRDNTLIPTEAIRLAALGALIEGDRRYADLASEIRHFVGRVAGPSLDLLGTEEGRAQFVMLMTSGIRAPVNDVSKLVIALKMRFLDLLDREDRLDQIELMREMSEGEVARLRDLRNRDANGVFSNWLDFEIDQLEQRIDWLENLAQ
jgi:hypothetical protein